MSGIDDYSEADLVRLAASGDYEAQCGIFRNLMKLTDAGLCDYAESSALGEVIARLAAAHGNPADQMTLTGLLFIRAQAMRSTGQDGRADSYLAEAVARLDELAEADFPNAQTMLDLAAEDVGPHVMKIADAIRRGEML